MTFAKQVIYGYHFGYGIGLTVINTKNSVINYTQGYHLELVIELQN